MSAWLIVEDSVEGFVNVHNLENVTTIRVDVNREGENGLILEVWTKEADGHPWEYDIKNLEEFEKLITLLPGAEQLGWIYIRDGKVDAWRGSLKLLERVEGEREPETGCWDEDAGEFRQPCP